MKSAADKMRPVYRSGRRASRAALDAVALPCYTIPMKTDIHPTYYKEAAVKCACGNTFTVGSTLEQIEVELCNKCHPFYTGKQKFVDTARRVEKFQERTAKRDAAAKGKRGKTVKRTTARATRKAKTVKK